MTTSVFQNGIKTKAELVKILSFYKIILDSCDRGNFPSLSLHEIPLELVNKPPFRIKVLNNNVSYAEHPDLPGLDLFIERKK